MSKDNKNLLGKEREKVTGGYDVDYDPVYGSNNANIDQNYNSYPSNNDPVYGSNNSNIDQNYNSYPSNNDPVYGQ